MRHNPVESIPREGTDVLGMAVRTCPDPTIEQL